MKIRIIHSKESLTCPYYFTDSIDDLQNRCSVLLNVPISSLYFSSFDRTALRADPNNYTYRVFDWVGFFAETISKKNPTKWRLFMEKYFVKKTMNLTDILILAFFKARTFPPQTTQSEKQAILTSDVSTWKREGILSKTDAEVLLRTWSEDYDKLRGLIKKNGEYDTKTRSLGKRFESIGDIESSPVQQQGHVVSFAYDVPTTLGYMFDRLRLDHRFPFAVYNTFVKTHDDFFKPTTTVPVIESEDDFFNTISVYDENGKLFLVVKNIEGVSRVMALLTHHVTTENDIDSVLDIDSSAIPKEASGIMATFSFADYGFDPALMADQILNNDMFSIFMRTNDSEMISKDNMSLFTYFKDPLFVENDKRLDWSDWNRFHSRFGQLTSILNTITASDTNESIVIRVIRCIDDTTLHFYRHVISKIISFYKQHEKDLVARFREYIPEFRPRRPSPEATTRTATNRLGALIEAEPELFPKNLYTSSCQGSRQPRIVSDAKVIDALPKNMKMLFPPEPIKGFQSRWYYCPPPEKAKATHIYKYPGLQNLTKSSHPIGIVPCCFKTDQSSINAKKIEKYITTTTRNDHKTSRTHLIKGNMLIKTRGQLGLLPPNLERCLWSIDPSKNYFRMGTSFGKDNFLDCMDQISTYCGKMIPPVKSFMKDRKRIFRNPRSPPQIACQENPGWLPSKIRDEFLRKDCYIDPQRFYRIMEEYLGVRILFFVRPKKSKDVIPFAPISYNKEMYIYPIKERPVVILYGHFGGRINDLYNDVNPHYEIIVYRDHRQNDLSEVQSCFPNIQPFIPYLYSDIRFTVGSQRMPIYTVRPSPFVRWLTKQRCSQHIDNDGKTRVFYVTNDKMAYVLCSPNAPLEYPLDDGENAEWILSSDVMLDDAGDRVVYRITVDGRQLHVLHYQKDSYLEGCFFVDATSSDVTRSITKEIPENIRILISYVMNTLLRPVPNTKILEEYKRSHKYALFLQSILLYVIQKYYKKSKSTPSVDRFLEKFIEICDTEDEMTQPIDEIMRRTDIVPSYKNIFNMFVSKRDHKIHLTRDVLPRIRYFLEWTILRRNSEGFYKQSWDEIVGFYFAPDDFHVQENVTIYKVVTSVEQTIRNLKNPYLNGHSLPFTRTITEPAPFIHDDWYLCYSNAQMFLTKAATSAEDAVEGTPEGIVSEMIEDKDNRVYYPVVRMPYLP